MWWWGWGGGVERGGQAEPGGLPELRRGSWACGEAAVSSSQGRTLKRKELRGDRVLDIRRAFAPGLQLRAEQCTRAGVEPRRRWTSLELRQGRVYFVFLLTEPNLGLLAYAM